MSINQLCNPIANGLDATFNSLYINQSLNMRCTDDQKTLFLTPPDVGTDGQILTRVGSSGNVEFKTLEFPVQINGLYMTTSDALAVTGTVEQSLLQSVTSVGSLSIPANAFKISSYHFNLAGTFSSVNAQILTIRLKANANTLGTCIINLTGTTSQFFEIECDFSIRRLGTSGVASIVTNYDVTYSDTGSTTFHGNRSVTVNSTTFDTTISNTLSITAQYNSTNAGNNMMVQQCVLNQIY